MSSSSLLVERVQIFNENPRLKSAVILKWDNISHFITYIGLNSNNEKNANCFQRYEAIKICFFFLSVCLSLSTNYSRTFTRNISAHTSCTSLVVPRNMYKNRQPSISLCLIISSSSATTTVRPSSSGQFKAPFSFSTTIDGCRSGLLRNYRHHLCAAAHPPPLPSNYRGQSTWHCACGSWLYLPTVCCTLVASRSTRWTERDSDHDERRCTIEWWQLRKFLGRILLCHHHWHRRRRTAAI